MNPTFSIQPTSSAETSRQKSSIAHLREHQQPSMYVSKDDMDRLMADYDLNQKIWQEEKEYLQKQLQHYKSLAEKCYCQKNIDSPTESNFEPNENMTKSENAKLKSLQDMLLASKSSENVCMACSKRFIKRVDYLTHSALMHGIVLPNKLEDEFSNRKQIIARLKTRTDNNCKRKFESEPDNCDSKDIAEKDVLSKWKILDAKVKARKGSHENETLNNSFREFNLLEAENKSQMKFNEILAKKRKEALEKVKRRLQNPVINIQENLDEYEDQKCVEPKKMKQQQSTENAPISEAAQSTNMEVEETAKNIKENLHISEKNKEVSPPEPFVYEEVDEPPPPSCSSSPYYPADWRSSNIRLANIPLPILKAGPPTQEFEPNTSSRNVPGRLPSFKPPRDYSLSCRASVKPFPGMPTFAHGYPNSHSVKQPKKYAGPSAKPAVVKEKPKEEVPQRKDYETDKDEIKNHFLFPMMKLLFDKIELASVCPFDGKANYVCSSKSFEEDFAIFSKQVRQDLPEFTVNKELDTLMVNTIEVLKYQLYEIEKVHELCDKFCERYIKCLKGKDPLGLKNDENMDDDKSVKTAEGRPDAVDVWESVQKKEYRERFYFTLDNHNCKTKCVMSLLKDYLEHASTCTKARRCGSLICQLMYRKNEHIKNCQNKMQCIICRAHFPPDESEFLDLTTLEQSCFANPENKSTMSEIGYSLGKVLRLAVDCGLVGNEEETILSEFEEDDFSDSEDNDNFGSEENDVSHSENDDVSHSENDNVSESQENNVSRREEDDVSPSEENAVSHSEENDVSHSEENDVSHSEENEVSRNEKDDVSDSDENAVFYSDEENVSEKSVHSKSANSLSSSWSDMDKDCTSSDDWELLEEDENMKE